MIIQICFAQPAAIRQDDDQFRIARRILPLRAEDHDLMAGQELPASDQRQVAGVEEFVAAIGVQAEAPLAHAGAQAEEGNFGAGIGFDELAFYRENMSFGVEPGLFNVMIGTNSRDTQSASFMLE